MRTTPLCFTVLFMLLIRGNDAVFSEYPVSRNVSLHSTVMFTCAVPNGAMITLSWNGLSGGDVDISPNTLTPDGVRHLSATFSASARFNDTNISCSAGGVINGMGIFVNSPPALLLIQGPLSPVGNLTSTEVDHCTLRLTWTAPYTLQGVPILNYTIGVNVDTDLPFMFSSDTTEYLYIPDALGETYTIMVTATNQAGQGAGSEIIVDIPKTAAGVTIPISIDKSNIQRSSTSWMIPFTINNQVICTEASPVITFRSCLTADSCVVGSSTSAAGTTNALVSFDLMENRKYNASMAILYNGGVEQQSQSIEISTFDVQGISITYAAGMVCIAVQYVQGHVTPAMSFVRLMSVESLPAVSGMIGASGCLSAIPGIYDLSVTDADAMNTIDTEPAITIANIVIPLNDPTVMPTPGASNYPSPGTTTDPTGPSEDPGLMLPIIAGAAGGGAALIAVIVIFIIIIIIVVVKKRKSAADDDDDSPVESARKEFTMRTSQTAVPLLATADNGYTSSLPAPPPDYTESWLTSTAPEVPLFTQTLPPSHKTETREHQQQLQLPSDDVKYSTLRAKDLFEEEDNCLEILHGINNLVFHHATLFQLLSPLSPLWYELGEELGLKTYLEKIEVNNMGNEESCLKAMLYVWEEQSQKRFYSWITIIKCVKSLGAVRLANALAQRTDNHSALQK